MVNTVPVPGVLSTSIVPLWDSIIILARGRPSPMPCRSLEKRLR